MVCVVCVCVLQRGNSGVGCVLASTLCNHTLRTGDLFESGKTATSEGEVSLQSF